jgi:hypothetical protein
MNEPKGSKIAPACAEVARGAGSLEPNQCPHCEQHTDPKKWPFCSWCRLFIIELDRLNLSPTAPFLDWYEEVTIEHLN